MFPLDGEVGRCSLIRPYSHVNSVGSHTRACEHISGVELPMILKSNVV